jgi:hypothetical protein
MGKFKKIALYCVIGIIVLAIIGALADKPQPANSTAPNNEQPKTEPAPKPKEEPKNKPTITLAEFQQIKNGMTYQEVVKIIGGEGTIQSEAGDGQYKVEMYSWEGEGDFGANANVTFQGGKVTAKAQFGLK